MPKGQIEGGIHVLCPSLAYVTPPFGYKEVRIRAPECLVPQNTVDVLPYLGPTRQVVARDDASLGRDLLEGQGCEGRVEAHGFPDDGL